MGRGMHPSLKHALMKRTSINRSVVKTVTNTNKCPGEIETLPTVVVVIFFFLDEDKLRFLPTIKCCQKIDRALNKGFFVFPASLKDGQGMTILQQILQQNCTHCATPCYANLIDGYRWKTDSFKTYGALKQL